MRRIDPEEERKRLARLLRRLWKLRRLSRREAKGKAGTSSVTRLVRAPAYLGSLAKSHHYSANDVAATVRIPQSFSFIENPEATLAALARFAHMIVRERNARVRVDHSECQHSDLCAESVLSAIALDAQRHFHVSFAGRLPSDPKQKAIVLTSGIPKQLGVTDYSLPDFHCFPLVRGGARTTTRARDSTPKEVRTTEVVKYVNSCLGRLQHRLTDPSAMQLGCLLCEVLDNAELHSPNGDWWIAAYLHHEPKSTQGDCHITIFNFGRSIYESLSDLPSGCSLRTSIETLVDRHAGLSLFSRREWEPEDLWTLYALQEGVSRLNPTGKGDRGNGTADLVEYFLKLGQLSTGAEKPRMALISGHTSIVFDGTYPITLKQWGVGRARRMVAFNASNDLNERPDSSAVRHLRKGFPGTVISLRFFLDIEHLHSVPNVKPTNAY